MIRAIKTAKCLPEVEWRSCGNWTTRNGATDTAIIIAAWLVQTSVLTPEPTLTLTH